MASISENEQVITLTNNFATFQIQKQGGFSKSYFSHSLNQELLPNPTEVFARYAVSAADVLDYKNPESIGFDAPGCDNAEDANCVEGTLKVKFASNLVLEIYCKSEPEYFLFELTGIDTSAAENLSLDDIALVYICLLGPSGNGYGGFIGAVHKDKFVLNLVALNRGTQVFSTRQTTPDERYAMLSLSYSVIGLIGQKVALLGCPDNEWPAIMELIAARFGLPRPLIDGLPAKRHPDVKSSYLFVDLTKENAALMIQHAKRGRFGFVMPYVWTWAKTSGTYEINCQNFPGGISDLQALANQLHDNGLKLGLHAMSFGLSKSALEHLVAIPHPGLARESPLILESALGAGNAGDPIPLLLISAGSDAAHVEAFRSRYGPGGEREILIGCEIFTFKTFVAAEPGSGLPHRFENCTRGMYGTSATSGHPAGSTVWHLPESFGMFLADPDSELPDLIAENFAARFNAVDGDFAFLDGSDCQKRLILQVRDFMEAASWYVEPLVADTYRHKLNREVLLQAGGLPLHNSLSWHSYTRGNSGDFRTIGVEGAMDYIRIGHMWQERFESAFFPLELGWIALLARTGQGAKAYSNSFPSTTLDEIEYQMNRSLGFGLPISLESDFSQMSENGSTRDILDLIGEYESLRLSGSLHPSLLEKLRSFEDVFVQKNSVAKAQYELVRKKPLSASGLKRKIFLERVLEPGESWTFENPFHSQKLKVKITALPAVWPGNYLELSSGLCSFEKIEPIAGVRFLDAEAGIRVKYAPTAEYPPPLGYCWLNKTFAGPLNLSDHKAIELELSGDGKGEVVAIHLYDHEGNQRQFQFEIDFNGPKRIFFPLPSGNSFYDHPPWFSDVLTLRYFDWSQVTGMTIYVKKIPIDDEGVWFNLHSLRALAQVYETLDRPALTIGNRTLRFRESLSPRAHWLNAEPWDYLDFDGIRYRKYDGNNNPYPPGMPPYWNNTWSWMVPVVASGMNTLKYTHNGRNLALLRISLEDHPVFPPPGG